MTPDVSALYCPTCGASAAPDANYCIACGQPLQPLHERPVRRSLAPVRIIEAESQAEPEEPRPETALVEQAEPAEQSRALAALPRLAALAWRQPAVRSAVTTGASAVALSLVWRVAGAALSGGKARRALLPAGESMAPLVGDLLRGATPSKRLRRRGRRGEIVEEVVYIRRIFRR